MNAIAARRRRLASGLAMASLLALAGCGGDNPPPPPTITAFTAARDLVTAGTGTTLTAVFSNGTGTIDQGIGGVQSGTPIPTGNLTAGRTFTLTVVGRDGTRVSRQTTVQAVAAPVIDGFAATPGASFPGQPVALTWRVTGADSLRIDPGIGAVAGSGATITPRATTTYTLTATNAAGTAVTATVTVQVAGTALARIRVDRAGPAAVFRDATGRRFIPRGSSYVRLNWAEGGHHSTFQPGLYAPNAVDTALAAMERYGYNIVRVFLDHGGWASRTTGINGPWTTPGLEPVYLDNLADFIARATTHRIYVLLALEYVPHNQHYVDLMQPGNPALGGANSFWDDGAAMQAKRAYVTDLVDGLAARLGTERLSTVFAYELESEMFYSADSPPFSLAAGSVTTADGQTYSMADPVAREACADNNAVYFANLLTDAIKARDPGAMTTIGAFTYRAVGKPGPTGLWPIPGPGEDQRFPVRISVLARRSRLDFIDLHAYPLGPGYSLAADLDSSEWPDIPLVDCPVLMGEFGAFEMFYPDINAAATLMRDHQIEGWNRGFAGFLYWTYDTDDEPWPQLWTLMDGDGTINQVLAPLYRPDLEIPATAAPAAALPAAASVAPAVANPADAATAGNGAGAIDGWFGVSLLALGAARLRRASVVRNQAPA